ncbi:MAG: NDP-sugar synthase, partial [Natronomonas sp.]
PWFDIGTPQSYLEAVAWSLDGDSVIAESATVERSTIGPNVHVMADAEVTDSSLDGTLIFESAVIEGCEIHDTIIDEGTHIENVDLAGALIGAHTQLLNGTRE